MYDKHILRLVNALAGQFRQAGQLDVAERLYESLQRFQPAYGYPRLGRGMVCAERGEFSEAERLFREALSIRPEDEFATLCIGLAMLHQHKPGWREQINQAVKSGSHLALQILDKSDQPVKPLPRPKASSARLSGAVL